ncbi:MAG: right-handed parallel beta-helix repeat-containing protein, partial [Planctomycetota bacterium]
MNPSCHHQSISRSLILAGFAATLVSTAVHGGTVLYVDDDAPPPGDGLSWATAYPSLQEALAVAGASGGAVNEIHVAQGVYTPAPDGISTCCTPHGGLGCDDAGCEVLVCAAVPLCCELGWDAACAAAAVELCGGLCADARTATFQLLDGVALQGGYAGLGPGGPPDAQDTGLYETVLSGDVAGDDDTGGSNAENSYNVVTASGTGLTAVLDGFIITGGNADGLDTDPLSWQRGAGIWNLTGSPTITDCFITANSAVLGAGMYNRVNSNPHIQDCFLTENTATYGGGMYNWQNCHPIVTNCTFLGNVTEEGGGMTNVDNSSPTVEHCTFSGNVGRFGAGME